jgi:hypothetical protein
VVRLHLHQTGYEGGHEQQWDGAVHHEDGPHGQAPPPISLEEGREEREEVRSSKKVKTEVRAGGEIE